MKKQKHDHCKKFIITILAALIAVAVLGLIVSYMPSKPLVGNVLQEKVFNRCIDTDTGYNPLVAGTANDGTTNGEDYCFLGDGQKVDFCIGRSCYLREYSCDRGNPDFKRLSVVFMDRNCPNYRTQACYKGACADPQNVPPEVRQNSQQAAINPIYGSSSPGYEGGINAE